MTTRKPPPNKIVAKFTQRQLTDYQEQLVDSGYQRARSDMQVLRNRLDSVKTAQVQAVTKFLEEAGRIMSRAGYMLGKLNGDNSR